MTGLVINTKYVRSREYPEVPGGQRVILIQRRGEFRTQIGETLLQAVQRKLCAHPLRLAVRLQFSSIIKLSPQWGNSQGATPLEPRTFYLAEKIFVLWITTELFQVADIKDAFSSIAAKANCVVTGDHQSIADRVALEYMFERCLRVGISLGIMQLDNMNTVAAQTGRLVEEGARKFEFS